MEMSTKELLVLTAAIRMNGGRYADEAVKDAREILDNVDRQLEADDAKDLPFDPDFKYEAKCERCGLTESEAEGEACIYFENHGMVAHVGEEMRSPNHRFPVAVV